MGVQIINSGADYSTLNLGNAAQQLNDFFAAVGIIDDARKTAYRNMYNSLNAAGLWRKGMQIYPFAETTQAQHKWVLCDNVYALTETGTLTHDATGVTSVLNCYYKTNWTPPLDLSGGMTIGCFVVSVTTATPPVQYMAIVGENTGGVGDYAIRIATGPSSLILQYRYGQVATASTNVNTHTLTNGLYQLSGIGQNIIAQRNSTIVAQATNSSIGTLIGGGSRTLNLLAGMVDASGSPGSSSYPVGLKLSLAFAVYPGYNATELTSFYNIIQTFLTAVGR